MGEAGLQGHTLLRKVPNGSVTVSVMLTFPRYLTVTAGCPGKALAVRNAEGSTSLTLRLQWPPSAPAFPSSTNTPKKYGHQLSLAAGMPEQSQYEL